MRNKKHKKYPYKQVVANFMKKYLLSIIITGTLITCRAQNFTIAQIDSIVEQINNDTQLIEKRACGNFSFRNKSYNFSQYTKYDRKTEDIYRIVNYEYYKKPIIKSYYYLHEELIFASVIIEKKSNSYFYFNDKLVFAEKSNNKKIISQEIYKQGINALKNEKELNILLKREN